MSVRVFRTWTQTSAISSRAVMSIFGNAIDFQFNILFATAFIQIFHIRTPANKWIRVDLAVPALFLINAFDNRTSTNWQGCHTWSGFCISIRTGKVRVAWRASASSAAAVAFCMRAPVEASVARFNST